MLGGEGMGGRGLAAQGCHPPLLGQQNLASRSPRAWPCAGLGGSETAETQGGHGKLTSQAKGKVGK